MMIETHVLTRTDPVIWKKSNKVVFGQRVEFKILLLYLNPCKEFDDPTNDTPHYSAKMQCQALFKSEWVNNIKAIARIGSRIRSYPQTIGTTNTRLIRSHNNSSSQPAKKVKKQIVAGIATAVFSYQIITNLVSNAISYLSREHGSVVTTDNSYLGNNIAIYEKENSAIKGVITKLVDHMNSLIKIYMR